MRNLHKPLKTTKKLTFAKVDLSSPQAALGVPSVYLSRSLKLSMFLVSTMNWNNAVKCLCFQIIQQTRQVVESEQNREVEKWKRLAQLKNRELDKFRTELDSMLDVLRELHRQGVVVPVVPLGDEVNTAEF